MSMTRRDFENAADALREALNRCTWAAEAGRLDYSTVDEVMRTVLSELQTAFKISNRAFDKDKFAQRVYQPRKETTK